MDFGEINCLEHEQRFEIIQESQNADKNREKLQVGKLLSLSISKKKFFSI